eukprot:Skav211470  [mRNA]  locus=scaffold1118:34427:34984:- [translate_table: standard]
MPEQNANYPFHFRRAVLSFDHSVPFSFAGRTGLEKGQDTAKTSGSETHSSEKLDRSTAASEGPAESFSETSPATRELRKQTCVFHLYTSGCYKGANCKYSHLSDHVPVEVPGAPARKIRPEARGRIKERVLQYLIAENLYDVHDELQDEAQKSPYARHLIKTHLEVSRDRLTPSTPGVQKVLFSL